MIQLPARPVRPGNSGKKGPSRFLPRPVRQLIARVSRPLPAPVRVAFLWLAPVLLIVAALVALFALSGGVTLRALEQHQYNADSAPSAGSDFTLTSSHLIGQSFRTPRDGINRISLTLSSQPNFDTGGEIRLVSGDGITGTVLYAAPLNMARFDANPFMFVDVPSMEGNSEYTIVFETPNGPLTQAFAVRYNTYDVLSSGSLYTDDGANKGDLAISLYYTYGLPNLLADLGGALSFGLFTVLAWLLLLFLPGLALLSWLASGLNWGQRVLAAPALTILGLPVLLLVAHSAGIPLGAFGIWLILLISAGAFGWALYRSIKASRAAQSSTSSNKTKVRDRLRLLPTDLLFWGLLILIFALTMSVRLMPLRDATAGLGVDAYHHTLISRMIIDSGGLPQNYLPYADLSSFTYHFGFHSLVASLAWITGQTAPEDLLLLMPQVGQFGIALPVLTLTLFGWRAFNNRWAGLIAGAFAGLACIFPTFYVNWSRYTQGLGLALLPVTWVLTLNIFHFPDMGYKIFNRSKPTTPDANSSSDTKSEIRNLQSAIDRSGPYILGVIGIAGLFLTHYRIAMIYVVMFALYVGVRLVLGLTTRRGKSGSTGELSPAVIIRRSAALGLLTIAALSPWLLNLSQNFHSHLVGRTSDESALYYDISNMEGFIKHPTMLTLYVLGLIGLILAFKQRTWSLVLITGAWLLIGLWSSPYLLSGILPNLNLRLPFAGYLDINTWIQSLFVPLALLAGYAVEWFARLVLHAGNSLSGVPARFWRTGLRASGAVALVLIALSIALPISANLDGKAYIEPADREALLWMRDNLPRNAKVLSNPFAFPWTPTNVLGSDAGMWIPLVSGINTTVPPLPAYNETQVTPAYLDDILSVIQYEPFNDQMTNDNWQALKDRGINYIYTGSRGGALDVSFMLASDRTQLIFHTDAVYVFEIK